MATTYRSATPSHPQALFASLSAQNAVPQPKSSSGGGRVAVGYVRVSTSVQAEEGLSLDAQRETIKNYCDTHGLRLFKIYEDVESGGKPDRIGLKEALAQRADVFVVLKFDRLSRSIKHFCQLYEDHFASRIELVAIREAIKLDSALGRALVSILLVFAQMEREATGERTKEALAHMRRSGYHIGKPAYGYRTVPAPDNPKYSILAEREDQQIVLKRIKVMAELDGQGQVEIAKVLNAEGIIPPRGPKWTRSLVYNLQIRAGIHVQKPVRKRPHTDEDCKARILILRGKGHTYLQIANILNEEGYLPYKGDKFRPKGVRKLVGISAPRRLLTPREYCQHLIEASDERLSLSKLAEGLIMHGYQTPRGNCNWWPAQVSQLMAGNFDEYYRRAVK